MKADICRLKYFIYQSACRYQIKMQERIDRIERKSEIIVNFVKELIREKELSSDMENAAYEIIKQINA